MSTSTSFGRSPPRRARQPGRGRPRPARHAVGGQPAVAALEARPGRSCWSGAGPAGDPGRRDADPTARQVDLLLADAARELSPGGARPVLPIAVNADSLATWVLPALAPIADDVLVDVRREDQTRTGTLLRDGTVVAAVTTEARPVAGCRSTPLGAMRYRPMASPALARRCLTAGVTAEALAHTPMVVFDRADDLQHAYLRRHPPPDVAARALRAVVRRLPHRRPARHGLGDAARPPVRAAPGVRGARRARPRRRVDVELHWQRWALRTPALAALTDR
jgi:LysR family transcriptional regulator (chromosome initiation inhibitor)